MKSDSLLEDENEIKPLVCKLDSEWRCQPADHSPSVCCTT